jgi:ferric-dicitrate binding protein FerR (iron transport regulator)
MKTVPQTIRTHKGGWVHAMALAACFVFAPGAVWAQSVAAAKNAIGTLIVVRTDGIQERLQGAGSLPIYEGDVVQTDESSQGMIQFKDGVEVALNESTSFKILSRWKKGRPLVRIIRLKEGEIWVRTGEGGPKAFEVETPVATAAVKETEFDLKVQPDGQSVLTVINGIVEFGTPFGTCPIKPSTISYGNPGKKCTKPAPTDAAAAKAWTKALVQHGEP